MFRKLLKNPGIVVMPGAFDALSAKIIEKIGFDAIIHTGYGTAATLIDQPDVGLVSFKEMVDRVKEISRAVKIPVIGDSDTGYGNAVNAYRTTKEYIWSGAAGLFMEDQVWPKRCGHLLGKEVISIEEMSGKIAAASDARKEEDKDFIIGARTDAIAVNGIEDAIERGVAFRKSGADFVFLEAYNNIDEMKRAVKEIRAPLMLNLIEGGRTPLISVKEAEKLGFKLVLFPLTALYSATKAMYDNLKLLKKYGSSTKYIGNLVTFTDFEDFVNFNEFKKIESRYVPKSELKKRYTHRT